MVETIKDDDGLSRSRVGAEPCSGSRSCCGCHLHPIFLYCTDCCIAEGLNLLQCPIKFAHTSDEARYRIFFSCCTCSAKRAPWRPLHRIHISNFYCWHHASPPSMKIGSRAQHVRAVRRLIWYHGNYKTRVAFCSSTTHLSLSISHATHRAEYSSLKSLYFVCFHWEKIIFLGVAFTLSQRSFQVLILAIINLSINST